MSNKRECLCSGCKRRFTSVTAFDKHQTGRYERGVSRCMSEERMRAAGLEQDAASGLWRVKQGRNMQQWLERKRDQERQSREQLARCTIPRDVESSDRLRATPR